MQVTWNVILTFFFKSEGVCEGINALKIRNTDTDEDAKLISEELDEEEAANSKDGKLMRINIYSNLWGLFDIEIGVRQGCLRATMVV